MCASGTHILGVSRGDYAYSTRAPQRVLGTVFIRFFFLGLRSNFTWSESLLRCHCWREFYGGLQLRCPTVLQTFTQSAFICRFQRKIQKKTKIQRCRAWSTGGFSIVVILSHFDFFPMSRGSSHALIRTSLRGLLEMRGVVPGTERGCLFLLVGVRYDVTLGVMFEPGKSSCTIPK